MLFDLFIIAIMLACALALYAHRNGIVYWGRTAAGSTLVHADNYVMREPIRVLEVDGTYQSATYLDERWADPVFPYHLLFDHMFDAWPKGDGPRTVAVLGGGGYAIPKHLVMHHPEVERIDVVEIDPAIERLARRFFFVDRLEQVCKAESSGRLRLHVADAHDWLEASACRFDAIVNDCFFGLEPDAELMSESGTKVVAEHLTDDGVYLTNVVAALEGPDAGDLRRTIASLQRLFSHIWLYPCSGSEPIAKDNNIVIATNAGHSFKGAREWPVARTEAS